MPRIGIDNTLLQRDLETLLPIILGPIKIGECCDFSNFTRALGKKRIKQYVRFSNIDPMKIYDFVSSPTFKTYDEQKAVLITLEHPELNIYLGKQLDNAGINEVYMQGYNKFDPSPLAEDLEVYIKHNTMFVSILRPSGKEVMKNLECGKHLFITCADAIVPPEILGRVKYVDESVKDDNSVCYIHVYIPCDSTIFPELIEDINAMGADVIVSDITKEELTEEALRVKSIFGVTYPSTCFVNFKEMAIDPSTSLNEVITSRLGISTEQADRIIESFGEERLRHYLLSKPTVLDDIYNYCFNNVSNTSMLSGLEFNVFWADHLESIGAQDIILEHQVDNVTLDMSAIFNGQEEFIRYSPDGSRQKITFEPGRHYFELKSVINLNSEAFEQLYRLKASVDKLHLVVTSSTRIEDHHYKKLNDMGIDIIVADISKPDLMKRVQGFKNNIYKMEFICEYSPIFAKDLEANGLDASKDSISRLIDVFGESRLRVYLASGISIGKVVNYLEGKIKSPLHEYLIDRSLKNFEFAYNFADSLNRNRADYLDMEFRNSNVYNDLKLNLAVNLPTDDLYVVKRSTDGKMYIENLPSGDHLFVFNTGIDNKVELLESVRYAVQNYNNVHLATLIDSTVKPQLLKSIYELGADVIISRVYPYQLTEPLARFKRAFNSEVNNEKSK